MRLAVIVFIEWDPEASTGFKEGFANRVLPLIWCDRKRPIFAAKPVRVRPRPCLQAFEQGKYVSVTPSLVPQLCPMIKVGWCPAIEDISVDR